LGFLHTELNGKSNEAKKSAETSFI